MGDGVFMNQWLFVDDGATTRAVDEDFDVSTAPADRLPDTQSGPSRMTAWVPAHELTLVNLGAAYAGNAPAPSIEAGISGRTLHHAHLHTMGLPTAAPTTPFETAADFPVEVRERAWVRLGIPTDTSVVAGSRAFEQNSIWSVQAEHHNRWPGYSMLTSGAAVQESLLNHVLLSNSGDLRVAGQRSVSIGSPTDVLVAVHKGAAVAEFTANTADQADPSAPGPGKIHQETKAIVDGIHTGIQSAKSIFFAVLSDEMGYNRSPLVWRSGWSAAGVIDFVSMTLGAVVAAGQAMLIGLSPAIDTPGGRLDLFSSNSANLTGVTSASMYGGVIASLSSSGVTTVSAPTILSLSTSGLGLISGTILGLTAIAPLSLESTLSGLSIRSRLNAELSSYRGRVLVTSRQDAQVSSTDGQLHLHGRQGVYLGAGGGRAPEGPTRYAEQATTDADGFGLNATSDWIRIGKLPRANLFGADVAYGANACYPRFFSSDNDMRHIEISSTEIRIKYGPTEIILDSQGARILSNDDEFVFGGGEAQVSCQRIQLG